MFKHSSSRRGSKNDRNRGFTLIEVLVVVAIIALLISILLPSLKRAREQARIVVCASSLKTCGQAVTFYLEANKDVYMDGNWGPRIHKYVQNSETANKAPKKCSVEHNGPKYDGSSKDYPTDRYIAFYDCPSDKINHSTSPAYDTRLKLWVTYPLSFGINNSLIYKEKDASVILEMKKWYVSAWSEIADGPSPITLANGDTLDYKIGMRKSASVERPSDIVMLMDSGDDDFSVGTWYDDQSLHAENDNPLDRKATGLQIHHERGGNFLYADYHVGYNKALESAYQRNVPSFPWSWVPLKGWKITRENNPYDGNLGEGM